MLTKWTRFNHYLYPHWKRLALTIFLGLVSMFLALINPYLIKLMIDKAYPQHNLKLFLLFALTGGIIFALITIINSYSGYLNQRVNSLVKFRLTNDIFRCLQQKDLAFFRDKSAAEHLYKVNSDVGMVSNFICVYMPQLIILVPRSFFILAIVFFLNWKIALLSVLIVPLCCINPYFFKRWLRDAQKRLVDKAQKAFFSLHEAFSHILLTKVFHKEKQCAEKLEKEIEKVMYFECRNSRLLAISGLSNSLLNKTCSGIIVIYCGYQVISGNMTLGDVSAVMIYLMQFFALAIALARFSDSLAINSVSQNRLDEIFQAQPLIKDYPGAKDYSILRPSIEFKDLTFGYAEKKVILRGIGFYIEPCQKIALTGPSGCGKTTLLNLLLRLYEPWRGEIFIDGHELKDFRIGSLREQTGIALQEPFLWDSTVKDNILYGNENATIDELIEASKIAQAHDFILGLPQQYDTQIGEMACKISEGQKQRIAIARAVIKKPKILILDEAMASIDSETEGKIVENLKNNLKNSTIIVISHNSATLRKMDSVYFFKNPSEIIPCHDEKLQEKYIIN
ncbi:MAG: ABC transporter ATP-binding protein [Candidatus Omnitrophota bacterium]